MLQYTFFYFYLKNNLTTNYTQSSTKRLYKAEEKETQHECHCLSTGVCFNIWLHNPNSTQHCQLKHVSFSFSVSCLFKDMWVWSWAPLRLSVCSFFQVTQSYMWVGPYRSASALLTTVDFSPPVVFQHGSLTGPQVSTNHGILEISSEEDFTASTGRLIFDLAELCYE